LAGCWMVLCGPASESCTYILLAPILAWAALEAAMDHRPLWSRCIPWCSFVLFVLSQITSWFPEQVRMLFLGILPLAGIVLWIGLVESSIRNLFQNPRAVAAAGAAHVVSGRIQLPTTCAALVRKDGFRRLHAPRFHSRESPDGVKR
jgi:hypothetical protein